MPGKKRGEERRKADPYLDRRSGEDRRDIYLIDYFSECGTERRDMMERRNPRERRKDGIKVSKWSSVCQKKRTVTTDD